MEELDTYVTNHNDDPTNRTTTFVIPFVRDIVAREYSDDAISITMVCSEKTMNLKQYIYIYQHS